MSTLIGPITESVIEGIIDQFRRTEIKERLMNNIIDPILADIVSRYYSYFMMFVAAILLIIILLIIILVLILKKK